MTRRLNHIHKRNIRVRVLIRVLALFAVCLMPLLLFQTTAASERQAHIKILAEGGSIIQGEEIPAHTAEVVAEGGTEKVLEHKSGYTVKNLIEDIKKQKGYKIECDAQSAVEGRYAVSVTLDAQLKKKLERDWLGLVTIETADSIFQVKNPLGDWDGDKFKRYDGTYVADDFVVSMGKTYYFNADGIKVTGWQDINSSKYYFDGDGTMKTGWQDMDGQRYYFGDNGAAAAGWQNIEGADYYFDSGGKMFSGIQYIGMMICTFGEDGKLISKKESAVDPSRPMAALTFDDGPGPRTGEILEELAKYNAHATFFMLGQKVPSYANEVARMKEIGCELGNHSYDHADLSKGDQAKIQSEVGQTNDNIKNITGEGATVMRPPYGAISEMMKTSVGMPMILWNIDTLDWKTRNAQATIDTVMGTVKDGDVILMHDIHTESVDAALQLIPKLIDAGYQLVTVSEMAAAKGVPLHNGGSYTNF